MVSNHQLKLQLLSNTLKMLRFGEYNLHTFVLQCTTVYTIIVRSEHVKYDVPDRMLFYKNLNTALIVHGLAVQDLYRYPIGNNS